MAEQRGRLPGLVEVAQDRTHVGILHQVDDRGMAARHEHARIPVQPCFDDRAQRVDLVHRGIVGEKALGARIGGLVVSEMRGRVGSFVDLRLAAVRGGEDDLVTGMDQRHRRHDGFVKILADLG